MKTLIKINYKLIQSKNNNLIKNNNYNKLIKAKLIGR